MLLGVFRFEPDFIVPVYAGVVDPFFSVKVNNGSLYIRAEEAIRHILGLLINEPPTPGAKPRLILIIKNIISIFI